MPEQPPYEEEPHHGPEGPPREDLAMAPTGFGGTMDLGTSEAETLEKTPGGPEGTGPKEKPRSLWSDAWRDLRRNPVFIVSGLVIVFLVVISIWPSLITDQ